MLGKRGVSGVFIGREGASPREDGGSKFKIRGYGGSKNTDAYPSLNVGYPRVKGRKVSPLAPRSTGDGSTGCYRQQSYIVSTLVHAKLAAEVQSPPGPVRSLKTIGQRLKFRCNANDPDLDEYSLANWKSGKLEDRKASDQNEWS